MSLGSRFLSGFWSLVRKQNSFLLLHLLIIILFSLFYRYMAVSGGWGLSGREVSELSSMHSSLYYSLITEFTIGALNNPESFWLRTCVMIQILTSFIFLNLWFGGPAPQDPPAKKRVKRRVKKRVKKRVLLAEIQKKCKKAIFQINVFFRDFFGTICQKKLVGRVYILNKNFSSYWDFSL